MSDVGLQSRSRPWRNVLRAEVFYCRWRTQCLLAAQMSLWTDFWWKCQCLFSPLHLQSVSGHYDAVTTSPWLSITRGRDIIVLTQLECNRADDIWGVLLRELKNQEKWKTGVWMSLMNICQLSDNMELHYHQSQRNDLPLNLTFLQRVDVCRCNQQFELVSVTLNQPAAPQYSQCSKYPN